MILGKLSPNYNKICAIESMATNAGFTKYCLPNLPQPSAILAFYLQQKMLAEMQYKMAEEDGRHADDHYNTDVAERLKQLQLQLGTDSGDALVKAEADKMAEAKKLSDALRVCSFTM